MELDRRSGFVRLIARFLGNESGATALEYVLIASLVSLAVVGGASTAGSKIASYLQAIADKL